MRRGLPRRRALLVALAAVVGVAACDPAGSLAPTDPSAATGPTSRASGPTTSASTAPSAGAGKLAEVGFLTVSRAAHTATALPDGRVLVAGGCTRQSCEGITASTELVDPTSGQSVVGPDLLEPRVGHAAVTLLDGRILLIGGFGTSQVLRTTELFDPADGTFAPGPELTEPRTDAATVVLADGSVLVAGGFDGRSALATAEVLDATATAFEATAPLGQARTGPAAVLLADGRVLVAGGSAAGATGEVLAGTEVYDPVTGAWATTGEMSTRRHKLAALTLGDGRVLVVGGSDERDGAGRYRSAELYDPACGTFAATADMAASRYKIAGALARLLDGRVLVAGGARTAEIFDPVAGRFDAVGGDANADVSFATAVLSPNGSVLVIGGYDASITLTDQVLRYTP
jgi:hypothetical protein